MDSELRFSQQLHPNLDLFGFPYDTGDPNTCPSFGNPYHVQGLMLENATLFPIYRFLQPRANVLNDSPNWFNRMPYFHHEFTPELNSAPNEKLSVDALDIVQLGSAKTGTSPAQKRFLIFDQSGDKTTWISTPEVFKALVPLESFGSPNPSKNYHWDGIYPLSPRLVDGKVGKNSWDISEDEMREDTEELNALLCSDGDYSEDDEETSTGHSPSTMTENCMHGLMEETVEKVNSFAGPTKRQKLDSGGYCSTLSNGHTASPLTKTSARSSLESDAESSCGRNSNNQCKNEMGSLSCGKRSRKEKILETLTLLQSIIPGAKGKIAIDIIDEAISYLRSLKVKAKALGLDTI